VGLKIISAHKRSLALSEAGVLVRRNQYEVVLVSKKPFFIKIR